MTVAVVTAFVVVTAASVAMAADWSAPRFFQDYCASCHGKNGFGNGEAGALFNPKPRNFHDCKVMLKITDKTLFHVIKYGGASVAGVSRNMPSWGDSLTDEQIKKMIKYVRHFCPKTANK